MFRYPSTLEAMAFSNGTATFAEAAFTTRELSSRQLIVVKTWMISLLQFGLLILLPVNWTWPRRVVSRLIQSWYVNKHTLLFCFHRKRANFYHQRISDPSQLHVCINRKWHLPVVSRKTLWLRRGQGCTSGQIAWNRTGCWWPVHDFRLGRSSSNP